MKSFVDRMVTLSFKDYNQALLELRDWLDKGNTAEKLEDGDFFFLLRPYCWFLHDPGFQDVLDRSEAALQVMMNNKDTLWEDTNAMLGNKFLAMGTFLASYVDEGDYNPSEWKMMFASPEVNINVTAKEYAEKLKETDVAAAAVLEDLADIFFDIEAAKHLSYYVLRHIAADYTDFLGTLIHKLPGSDQTYILHAFDQFGHNEKVIAFYKNYIENAASDYLKTEAQKYLERIDF